MENTKLLNNANYSDFFDFIDIVYKSYIIRYGGGYVSIWENEEKEIDCYIDNIYHFTQFKKNIKNKINNIINDKNFNEALKAEWERVRLINEEELTEKQHDRLEEKTMRIWAKVDIEKSLENIDDLFSFIRKWQKENNLLFTDNRMNNYFENSCYDVIYE